MILFDALFHGFLDALNQAVEQCCAVGSVCAVSCAGLLLVLLLFVIAATCDGLSTACYCARYKSTDRPASQQPPSNLADAAGYPSHAVVRVPRDIKPAAVGTLTEQMVR